MARRQSYKRKVPRKSKRVSVHVYAARLRRRMTLAEKKLEQQLKLKIKKWVFESQGVVGVFIADFVCRERMLVIECDGSIHNKRMVKRKDAYRTMVLRRLGYSVIRFTNKQVFDNCAAVVQSIKEHI